jgi:hypothetical protein
MCSFVSQFPQLGYLNRVGIVEQRRIFKLVKAKLQKRTLPADMLNNTVSVKDFDIAARDRFRIPVRYPRFPLPIRQQS